MSSSPVETRHHSPDSPNCLRVESHSTARPTVRHHNGTPLSLHLLTIRRLQYEGLSGVDQSYLAIRCCTANLSSVDCVRVACKRPMCTMKPTADSSQTSHQSATQDWHSSICYTRSSFSNIIALMQMPPLDGYLSGKFS